MKAQTALLTFFLMTGLFLISLATFNWTVDAQCYYRCKSVTLEKQTTNSYYRTLQRSLAFPEARIVIVGSSRGETLLPGIVEKLTNQSVINLSVAGSEVTSKIAFLNFSREQNSIKTVIWMADYFELIKKNQDSKMRKTPFLKEMTPVELQTSSDVSLWEDFQGLFDHNTTEASFYLLNHSEKQKFHRGGISNLTSAQCMDKNFNGTESDESLKRKVHILYQQYINGIINQPQDPELLLYFKKYLLQLAASGVNVVILINPYFPEFLEKIKQEYPQIYSRHLSWRQELKSLASPHIEILDFLDGIKNTTPTPRFWNDGVHFSCHSAFLMIQDSLLLKE